MFLKIPTSINKDSKMPFMVTCDRIIVAYTKLVQSQDVSKSVMMESMSSPSLPVVPLASSCFLANPVPFGSLHKRHFCCASLTIDISNLAVHGMLQLRQFYFLWATSISVNVYIPVLLGFSNGHWILCVDSACFGAFFSLGFVPPKLVQAVMVLYSNV